ncbi:MAG: SPOR domain-containing protein [Methyloceanibacter sp.]
MLAPDKKWRLIAGPFASPDEAKGACSLFKKADRPCEATVYAGDAL